MTGAKYIIIGAGFAGAATAYHLARRGARDVVILEQEAEPGVHSSGRNAAMVRQVVPDRGVSMLARDGAAFLRALPTDWPQKTSFRQSGSLLLGQGEAWEKLKRHAEAAINTGIEVECWSAEKVTKRLPVLRGAEFDGAVWCATDGVVDIHSYLHGYLKAATAMGVKVYYSSALRGIEVKGERVAGISTDRGIIRADAIINCAGAWAGAIGRMAGAIEIPLRPCRRHLFFTGPLSWADPSWPFVWDVTHEVYFRPESGGLLLCPCDEDQMPPGLPATDDAILEQLMDKVKSHLPGLYPVNVQRRMAGLRTLSPDGRFVVGWDPKVTGFFWVAGLGGHGVTTSASVGALAASLILGEGDQGREFSPERFIET